MAKTPEQIVRDFGNLWERQDIEAVLQAMTPDCVYANVPVPAMHGHDEVRAFASNMLSTASKIEFIYHNVATAADGKTVMTERTDAFSFGSKRISVPVMGIFVLRGDKIHEWRDYCDITRFVNDMKAMGQTPGTVL